MEKNEIVFVCISDTHTHTKNLKLPEGDVLIHAGDFTYTGTPKEVSDFNDFLGKQNFKYKIVISGNHELTFDLDNYEYLAKLKKQHYKHYNASEIKKSLTNCIYLEDSACEVFGYKIYGSPWQITYDNWAFYAEPKVNAISKWRKIPDDTDILITHNPPSGIMDLCEDESREGCPLMLKEIKERIKPKVHVFGHVHEAYGIVQSNDILFINASTCDENYEPVNPPIVFKLPMKV